MNVTIEYPLYTVNAAGEDVETIYFVECELTPEDPGRWTMPNGDPGYPGSPAECEILTVKLAGVEVKYWELILDKAAQKEIEEKAFQKASDDDEGQREDEADRRRDERYEPLDRRQDDPHDD